MMMAKATQHEAKEKELSLLKTIATASREMNMELTRLQAIDRLHKLRDRFREQWIGASPVLVLKDAWMLPNDGPIDLMLKMMDKHGEPVGVLGIAWLTHSKKHAVLKMVFRSKADKQAHQAMERAAQEAEKWFAEQVRNLGPMKKD